MPARGTPTGFPAWLYSQKESWFKEKHCLWLCSGCGSPNWFKVTDSNRHAGPTVRLSASPWYSPAIGPCWRSREYRVKCATPRGGRILYHEGYDPPPQALIDRLTAEARAERRASK